MRKFTAIMLALLLSTAFATTAFAADWSSMSTEEILAEIDQARAELTARDLADPENFVLVDADGMTITITGAPEIEYGILTIPATAVSSSDKEVGVIIEEAYINGWQVPVATAYTLEPGKKAKIKIEIYGIEETAEITDVSQLEDIEFHMYTFDPTTYDTITDGLPATVVY